MDESRIIRYITPATFFYGNLFFGAWENDACEIYILVTQGSTLLISAVGASAFPIGFLISGLTVIVLESLFPEKGKSYSASFSDDAWKHIWKTIGLKDETFSNATKAEMDCAAQTYDHELEQNVHDCAVRNWNAFNIAANSCTALVTSFIVGASVLGIQPSSLWMQTNGVLGTMLILMASIARNRHMTFLELQTKRCKTISSAASDQTQ